MFPRGLYPAIVTPFDEKSAVDAVSLAKLLAWQESQGSKGVVLAGSNGEGASLSSVERRDLLREAKSSARGLKLILGLPSSSLEDVKWGANQAAKAGADALLISPPYFSRRASAEGVTQWLFAALEASPLPVILYHNPAVFGVPLPLDSFEELTGHPRCAGVKNSAPDPELFPWMRQRLRDHQVLLVGDETLLLAALEGGATGSISGAGNICPRWLAEIIAKWPSEEAQTKFDLVLPLLREIRSSPQPETHKSVLHRWGLIATSAPRLPLLPSGSDKLLNVMAETIGVPQ
jgi:4-hydroxy-tetrahydrodipicolinate synthase